MWHPIQNYIRYQRYSSIIMAPKEKLQRSKIEKIRALSSRFVVNFLDQKMEIRIRGRFIFDAFKIQTKI